MLSGPPGTIDIITEEASPFGLANENLPRHSSPIRVTGFWKAFLVCDSHVRHSNAVPVIELLIQSDKHLFKLEEAIWQNLTGWSIVFNVGGQTGKLLPFYIQCQQCEKSLIVVDRTLACNLLLRKRCTDHTTISNFLSLSQSLSLAFQFFARKILLNFDPSYY